MKRFKQLTEVKNSSAVFTFGRFNPPTTGHEKLIDAVARQHSKNAGSDMFVYASHSNDSKKNPLPHPKKIAYMRAMFPKYKKNILADKDRNIFQIATSLYNKGYRSVVMVVGSDRVNEFKALLNKYNDNKGSHGYYNFNNIEVVSAGERDPDAEGVEGMSASKMRAAALDGEYDSFKLGLPSGFKQGLKLFRDIRSNMGIREKRDMGEMTDYEEIRDAYLVGKIWNVGDLVESNGIEGNVVNRGTNYLSFCDRDGKVHKSWLHNIAVNKQNYKEEYETNHSDIEHFNEASAPDIKKGDTIILNKAKRPYTMAGITDPKKMLPAESDKMVVQKITRAKGGRKAHLTYHDTKKRGGFAIYLDNMPDFMSVKLAEEVDLSEDWINNVINTIDRITHPKNYEMAIKDYVSGMKNKKNKEHSTKWAADVAKRYSGIESRGLVQYINSLIAKGKLPKELKAQYNEVKQDSDIKDKEGTQPAKYHSGLDPETKKKRDAHFKAKKSGPAPGDDDAKTKLSVHTQKYKQMFDERKLTDKEFDDKEHNVKKLKKHLDSFKDRYGKDAKSVMYGIATKDAKKEKRYKEEVELDEKIKGLTNKSEKSGISYSILKKVYDRGMAAWKTGHRPGTTPQQWAFARVNSFITKGKGTWGKADADLAKQVEQIEEACWDGYKQVGMKKKGNKEVPNCVPEENELNEWGEIEEEAEYQGKKVKLNNPMKGDIKKTKVYVRNDKGNVVKVEFGDPNMEIKRDDPARRKSFRARHNCDNPGPKWKAKYWSCKFWEKGKTVTDLMKG